MEEESEGKVMMMDIEVKVVEGSHNEEPERLTLGQRTVSVVDILDRWNDQDKHYFKVQGEDDCTYLLCYDRNTQAWEVTMFERRDEIQEQIESAFRHSFRGKV